MTHQSNSFRVGDYTLDAERYYSRESHLWVLLDRPLGQATRARIT